MGSVFLIQVSGRTPKSDGYVEIANEYIEGVGEEPMYNHPLKYGFYLSTGGSWKENYGRKEAWDSIRDGDKVLVYCASSVKEHPRCLSHILDVKKKTIDNKNKDFARLEFELPPEELDPKIPYNEITELADRGKLSQKMGKLCGQQGFNFTEVDDLDLEGVRKSSESGRSFIETTRECDLLKFLRKNPETIESGLKELDVSEYLPGNLNPDLLFEDEEGGYLVVELKRGKVGYSGVGQLGSYIGAMKEEGHKGVRGLLVGSEFGEKAKYGARLLGIGLMSYRMSFDLVEE